jgi:hypothetical protein
MSLMNLTASSDVTFATGSDLNPLIEFVYSNQDMFVAAWSGTKWSYRVETPHSEGPRWRDSAQDLSWQVLLFGKNWHPLHLLTRSLASVTAVGQ